jgi:hypothetical protein
MPTPNTRRNRYAVIALASFTLSGCDPGVTQTAASDKFQATLTAQEKEQKERLQRNLDELRKLAETQSEPPHKKASSASQTQEATEPKSTAPEAPAVSLGAHVPKKFQGMWSPSAQSCSDWGETTLAIKSNRVDLWESRGPVMAVVVRKDEIVITAEISGEGYTWLEPLHFQISSDGNTLTDLHRAEPNHLKLYKCPKIIE